MKRLLKIESKTQVLILLFGLCCFISSTIYLPTILDFTLVPRLIAASVLLFLLLILIFKQNQSIQLKVDYIHLFYLSYLAWNLLSSFWAQTVSESIFENAKLLLAYFIFVIANYLLHQHKDLFIKTIIQTVALIELCLLVIVMSQLLSLNQFNKASFYLVTGLNGHKNLLSSFLFILSYFLIRGIFKFEDHWKWIFLLNLFICLLTISILRTKSVWLGLAIGLVFYTFSFIYNQSFLKKKFKIKPTLLLIILVFLMNIFFLKLFHPIITQTIQSQTGNVQTKQMENSKIDLERLIVWNKTYVVIKKHPLIGVGLGNWQIFFPDATLSGIWRAEDLNVTFQRPHNDFLWILSESGIIGFNLYLLLIFSILISFRQPENESRFFNTHHLTSAFVVGYLCISFFDFPKERIEHLIWFNILLAVLSNHQEESFFKKGLIKIRFNSVLFVISLLTLLGIAIVGIYRIKGEYYTRGLYSAKVTNDNQKVIQAGESAYSAFYSIDPTSMPIHWYIANARVNLKDQSKAHQDFLKAYQFNPYNRHVLNDLGSSYIMKGEIDMGIKKYQEASRISPRFDDPKLNLAAIFINQNKLNEAKSYLDSLFHDSERRKNYTEILNIKLQNMAQ